MLSSGVAPGVSGTLLSWPPEEGGSPSWCTSVRPYVCLCPSFVCLFICLSLSVFVSVCHHDIERFVVWEHKCLLPLKMVNYAWEGQSQKHSVVVPLTCQSYVMLVYRDERPVEPGSSRFPPQFPSHHAVNRERVVLDLFSDMFFGASFCKTFSTKICFCKNQKMTHLWQLLISHRELS